MDSEGASGHEKSVRHVPNTGGIAIFLAIVLPVVVGLIAVRVLPLEFISRFGEAVIPHVQGLILQTPLVACLLGSLGVLHIMGLIDDRRALGPWPKLFIQAGVAAFIVVRFDSRLLTMLDEVGALASFAPWPSVIVTVAWLIVVTNAINFMDNMDGLAGGVTAISATLFLVGACVNEQWFVAAMLAVLIGAVLGFLVLNFPPASIFMGDGGSLVLGFLLGFMTIRTTYFGEGAPIGSAWYGVFMPLIVLAIPLYDFTSVVVIRLSQGRNPFVGDQQHFSHRLVQQGLSPTRAILVIYGCTIATGIGGIFLGQLEPWQAILVGVQTLVILGVLAIYEHATVPRRRNGGS